MPYDMYRHWSGKGISLNRSEIERQVLSDLDKYTDETDKLEVLDSFRAFVEREEQKDLAEHFSNVLFRAIQPLLTDTIFARMPGSMPVHRGRPVAAKESREDSPSG